MSNTIESDGFLWRASRRSKTLFLADSCFQTRRSSLWPLVFFSESFLQVLRKICSARSKLANILPDCFWLTRRTKLREKDCMTVTYHFDCLTQTHKNLKAWKRKQRNGFSSDEGLSPTRTETLILNVNSFFFHVNWTLIDWMVFETSFVWDENNNFVELSYKS